MPRIDIRFVEVEYGPVFLAILCYGSNVPTSPFHNARLFEQQAVASIAVAIKTKKNVESINFSQFMKSIVNVPQLNNSRG